MKVISGHSSIPRFLALASVVFSLLCCTVKEDRDSCPCQLRFDLSEAFEGSDGTLTMVIIGESGFVKCDTLRKRDSLSTFAVQVPREKLTVDFYSPFGALRNPIEGYRPKDYCDSVWNHSFIIQAEGESMDAKVKLSKNYCALTVVMVGGYPGNPGYTLVFHSLVNGYLPGGGLSEGYFSQQVKPSMNGICSVNLLRQSDASLMMDVITEDDKSQTKVLRSFALGEYIAESDYDWNADNLEDLEISLDFAGTSVRLATDKWTKVLEFDIVI